MKRILALFVFLGLLASACGSESPDTDAGSDGTDSEALSSESVDDSGDAVVDNGDESDTDESSGSGESGSDDAVGDEDGESADGEGATTGDVLDASELDDLLAATSEQTSGRFEAVVEITGGPASEISGTVSMAFSGAFDEAAGASEMSMDMSGMMEAAMASEAADSNGAEGAAMMAMMEPFFAEPMQVRTIGDRSWIKWGLFAMFGAGDKWVETDEESRGDLTQDFGFDAETPSDALNGLADSGHTVEYVGEEDIRGLTADRYRSEIDVASMTAEQRDAFGEDLPEDGSYVLSMWFADGLLQRFSIDMTDLAQTGENDVSSLAMTYDMFDHGGDVAITAPSPDEILTEAELGFDIGDMQGSGG